MSECIYCGRDLPHNAPVEIINEKEICGDCAFINGLIEEEKYIKSHLYWLQVDGVRAVVYEGKIHITTNNHKFSFEMKTQDYRKCEDYKKWRIDVFNRDFFTCQCCGQVGGILNAHHIKEFSKYPELRFKVDNGITLCKSCHKEIHKKKGK